MQLIGDLYMPGNDVLIARYFRMRYTKELFIDTGTRHQNRDMYIITTIYTKFYVLSVLNPLRKQS